MTPSARGKPVREESMKNGGTRVFTDDGIQIRILPDGRARVDIPGRGPQGQETVHYNNQSMEK